MMTKVLGYAVWLILLTVSCSNKITETRTVSERAVERQIFELVNDYRRSKGLKALQNNSVMHQQAYRHSLDMARGRLPLGHHGFDRRVQNIREAIGVKGISGENVAEGYKTAREAFEAWKHSRGHRRHMLGNFDLTGIGVARGRNGKLYFTQLFIAEKN